MKKILIVISLLLLIFLIGCNGPFNWNNYEYVGTADIRFENIPRCEKTIERGEMCWSYNDTVPLNASGLWDNGEGKITVVGEPK